MPRLPDVRALTTAEPRRICIIKPSALGDVVQTLPVLAAVRARWPEASICWVIRDDLSDLVDGHPFIDEWLPFERRKGLRAFARLLRSLHQRQFDLTIDLQGLARSALMTAATGAAIRVGLENSRDAAFLAHNLVLPQTGRDVPAHVRYWRLAEAIGEMPRNPEAHIPISDRARQRADELLSRLSGMVLAVHPGAAWVTKRWPVGRFAAIASRAPREWGASIVVLGGPDERALARRLVASLRASSPGAATCDLSGRTSVGELAAVLERVDLLLTNDSGPMHLAAAVKTPVVGLFTATDPIRSGPAASESLHAPRNELVTTPSACRACYQRSCPVRGTAKNACQSDLSIDHVWQALVQCVDRNQFVVESAVTSTRSAAEPVLLRSQ